MALVRGLVRVGYRDIRKKESVYTHVLAKTVCLCKCRKIARLEGDYVSQNCEFIDNILEKVLGVFVLIASNFFTFL